VSAVFASALAALALGPLLAVLGPRASSLATALGCALLVPAGLAAVLHGAQPLLELGGWLGFGPLTLSDDGLAGIFFALTGITGAAAALAALERPAGRLQAAVGGTLALLVAVVIGAGNGFELLLAWEGLAICIYLLSSGASSEPRRLARGYLTFSLTKLGGAALLAAIGLLYARTHSFALAAWSHAALGAGTRGAAFALLALAFGSKVGVLPLQGSLPAGYAAAERNGASWLAVALGAGFYGLWRFEAGVLGPLPSWCGEALLVLGALGAIAGIVYAVTQDELRAFFGYSTVEHAGIALLGLGVALLGLSFHQRELAAAGLLAATLHVVAHNLAKTLALIATDRLELASGERGLDRLGGLARELPSTAAGLGLASLTLAAIPPLGGFVSEWLTFEALLQAFRMPSLLAQLLCALAAAALALTGGIGLLAFAKSYSFAFLAAARNVRERAAEQLPALGLWLLSAALLGLGTVAPWEVRAVGAGLERTLGFDLAGSAISYPLVLGPVFKDFAVLAPTWLSVVLPSYALAAAAIARSGGRGGVRRAPVWVTGAGAELAQVQYRPSAYSNPLRVVLRGPLGLRSRLMPLGAGRLRLERSVTMAIERFLYRPAASLALRASATARTLQSGRLSHYLLYMLLALAIALVLIPVLR
jgi:hydrogenase-4 component B